MLKSDQGRKVIDYLFSFSLYFSEFGFLYGII